MTAPVKRIVPLCELCRRIHDQDGAQRSAWTQLHLYMIRHQLASNQLVFARSYCDDCRIGHRLASLYGRG